MNKEELKKLSEVIDDQLIKAGVKPDQMAILKERLMKLQEAKSREMIANEVIKQLLNPISKEELLKAFKDVKIEPKIYVNPTPITVSNPEPRVIIKEPHPVINVAAPKVEVHERDVIFPKFFAISGLATFIGSIVTALKQKLNVGLEDINLKNPLHVVLTYDDKTYKAGEAGGGGAIFGGGQSRNYLKNKSNETVSPMSEAHDTIGSGNITVLFSGTPVALSATSVPCKKVIVHAVGGHIVVGGSTVVYAEATRKGIWLAKTQRETFYPSDLNKIYVDAALDNTLVAYYYEN